MTFKEELTALINRYSVENASDTPDFVLAEYLIDCLGIWETAVSRRDKWYGFQPWPPPTPENVECQTCSKPQGPLGEIKPGKVIDANMAGLFWRPCPDCTLENVEEPT